MLSIALRRIGGAFVTLLLASLVLFVMIRFAPGDPILLMMGQPGDMGINDTALMQERMDDMRAAHGLDRSIAVQFARWLGQLFRLNLGNSIQTGRSVAVELGERIPATLLLSCTALLFQIVLGISAGICSAVKANQWQDNCIRFVCVFFAAIPFFVIGLLLLLIFAVKFHIYEISSSGDLHRLWLPAFTMGLVGAPQLIRMVRAGMLSELGQTYIIAAVSRGLSRRLVIGNAFRNAQLPVFTTIMISFTNLIGGSVVVESIFSWPGLGSYAMNSILKQDYPAIQGYTVLIVATVIVVNLSIDMIYLLMDPRLRKSGVRKAVSNG